MWLLFHVPRQYNTVVVQHVSQDTQLAQFDDSEHMQTDHIPDTTPDSRPTFLMNQASITDDSDYDDDAIFTPQLFNFTTIRVTTSHFDTFLGNMHAKTAYSFAVSDGRGGGLIHPC